MFAEMVIERTAPAWFGLLVCGGGVLVLIGIGVAVLLLVTGRKDQRPGGQDKRP